MIMEAAQIADVTSDAPAIANTDETSAESKRNSARRERFDFASLEIEVGSILTFISPDDDGGEINSLVSQARPPRVVFDDMEGTLAEITAKAMSKGGSRSISGLAYWTYEGETLLARRRRLEEEGDD